MSRVALTSCFILLVSGCTSLQTLRGLMDYSQEQDALNRYVANQEKKIERLFRDIEENKLIIGKTTKKEIIKTYGDPILEEDNNGNQRLLYRKALETFPEKKAYLFFNVESVLVDIEIKT